MNTNVPYKSLSINERICAKTGWDIAVAYEGKSFGCFPCYTRLAVLLKYGVCKKLIGKMYRCYR